MNTFIRIFAASILAALPVVSALPVSADSPSDSLLPERRLILSRDLDFYGSDLQALFDTDYAACENLCLNDPACQAFTYNQRSNACFPKSDISDRQPYDGAWSGEFVATTPGLEGYAETQATRAADFIGARDLEKARAQAQKLGWTHPAGHYDLPQLLRSAAARASDNDWISAMRWMGGALSHTDAPEQWVEYARLSLKAAEVKSDTRRRYQDRALLAAINGYLRSQNSPQQAEALKLLAQAFEARDRGQDMIPALRLAQEMQPNWPEIDLALDDAIAKYGFRITEHDAESDSLSPRICAVFSDTLRDDGFDYSPYVKLPGDGYAVTASGNRLCVEGLHHGERYTLTFRRGLPASTGEAMVKDVALTQYIRDRTAAARFPGRAYVLPKSPDAALPIETVNVDRLDLTLSHVSDRNLIRAIQDQYFGRPLSYWEAQDFEGSIAEPVWQGEGLVENTLNRDMTTRLPMADVIADLPAGVYVLQAQIPGADPYDEPDAMQWFVLSDIGATTLSGTDGLHVFAQSLASAKPLAGLTATLISQSNRELGKITLDSDGHGVFAPGLTLGLGAAAPGLLVLENGADDVSFLSLKDPAFDLSDRGVEGRAPSPAIDVFLTTDRGAYRAGETIHVTALTRNKLALAQTGLPVTAILTRPDGVEHSRHLSQGAVAGGHVFALPLGPTVPRGSWRLDIKADVTAPALASTTVLVEDFLPERIDFTQSLPDGILRPGDSPVMTVEARYLFGAPAAGLEPEGTVVLRESPEVEGYAGYRFGRQDQRFSPLSDYFGGAETDAAGLAQVALTLPSADLADRPLEAVVITTLAEGSGRPVERRLTRKLAPANPIIGIKQLFDGTVREGTEAQLDVIALDPSLTPTTLDVRWTLNRVTRRYQWYQQWGAWEWEPITTRKAIATGTATLGDQPLGLSLPVDWGNYELVVETNDGSLSASSQFYAGWYAPADASKTPDTLELSLDKPAYRPGEAATLRLVPRYAGKALVTVLSNRVIAMKAVDVVEGENLISLDVTDEWGAGAYVTASVIRPMDVAAGRNPARALGLSYAQVDPGAKQLNVSITTPAEAAPRGPLRATVAVDGITEGDTAYVTVAAVDLGILNVTGFDSPNPSDHYFGQRRLGVEIRDMYGRLIDGLNGSMGQVRSGGDATSSRSFQSPPPTEELVAYFTGPVTTGPDGTAEVQFNLPAFNGTVRLMAVAWSETGVGQAETDVLVRDPVVVTASLPRFLAPGDQSRLLLEIVHATGPAGRMGLDVTAMGLTLDPSTVPAGLTLDPLGKAVLSLPVTATDIGDHSLRVALTTPDGTQLVKDLTLGVRRNDPEISTTQRFELASGQSFRLDENVFANLRPGSGSAVLAAGPLAKLNAPALLDRLDRYPYGCTEQVTSQALPLLYLSSVTEALGLGGQDRMSLRIAQAVEKVLTRQSRNGAFGLWRPDSGDLWLDAYVSDFLSRARVAGHEVPDLAFRMAMDNLRNRVNYASDFDSGGGDLAYALMVLAREGAASMGDLRYYADVKGDAFDTPLGAAQLGAALAQYGDQTRADAMFARASAMIRGEAGAEANLWRADYGTRLRDSAGVLALAVEAGSDAVDRSQLIDRISNHGPDFSTQEAVWSLLAAKALVRDPGLSGLNINGAPLTGPFVKRLDQDIASSPQSVTNTADLPTYLTLTTTGVPLGPTEAGGYGYRLERSYYSTEGTPLALDQVQTGDRLVTVLTVYPAEKGGARLMVNDPLPAGFEIDNPNLLRQGDIRALDWLDPVEGNHSEFRADRFLTAVDWSSDRPFELAYIVRAISPGQFHHPAAVVEDMYRPQYRANTASGQVVIRE